MYECGAWSPTVMGCVVNDSGLSEGTFHDGAALSNGVCRAVNDGCAASSYLTLWVDPECVPVSLEE